MKPSGLLFGSTWAAVIASGLAQTADANPTPGQIDEFLASVGVGKSSTTAAGARFTGERLACFLLEMVASEATIFPSDGAVFTDVNHEYWSSTSWGNPTCIFKPANPEQVSIAIKTLTFTNTKFAIRSGGHTPNAKVSSIDKGVLIATQDIKDLSYNAAEETVTTGFGNRWGVVYDYLEPYGRICVAGRVGDVGAALSIGGGLSHFSNKYGLVADNIVSFKIVLANGDIVTTSATSKPDLFFAVKGGANNFGIVTHVTMKTYPNGKVWGGVIIYNNTLYQDKLIENFIDFQKNGQVQDKEAAMLTYFGQNNETAIATYVHLGGQHRPESLKRFLDIPALVDTTADYESFAAFVRGTNSDFGVSRWAWAATTFYVDESMYKEMLDIGMEESKKVAGVNGGTYALMPQPISESMLGGSAKGLNPLGLRVKPQLWFSVSVGYNLAKDDAAMSALAKSTTDKIESLAKSKGLHDPFVFLNDAGPYQKPIQTYGAANVQKMQAVSRKYDPRGVFQKLVPGGFKVFD